MKKSLCILLAVNMLVCAIAVYMGYQFGFQEGYSAGWVANNAEVHRMLRVMKMKLVPEENP